MQLLYFLLLVVFFANVSRLFSIGGSFSSDNDSLCLMAKTWKKSTVPTEHDQSPNLNPVENVWRTGVLSKRPTNLTKWVFLYMSSTDHLFEIFMHTFSFIMNCFIMYFYKVTVLHQCFVKLILKGAVLCFSSHIAPFDRNIQ